MLYQTMKNVRHWIVISLLLAVIGALGVDHPGGDLHDNLSDHRPLEEPTGDINLAHSDNATFSIVQDSVYHHLWEYSSGLVWFIAYIEHSPRLLENLALISICIFLGAVAVGSSMIARRKSVNRLKCRKLLAKRQRSRFMVMRAATSMALHEAQHSVLVDADSLASTFLGTKYLKLVWDMVCRRWALKRLEVNQQRLSAKATSRFETICFLKEQIYPSEPRRWRRLLAVRRPCGRTSQGAAPSGILMPLPQRSSLHRWVLTLLSSAFPVIDCVLYTRTSSPRRAAVTVGVVFVAVSYEISCQECSSRVNGATTIRQHFASQVVSTVQDLSTPCALSDAVLVLCVACRQREDPRNDIFEWVLLKFCAVLCVAEDFVGLLRRQQYLCRVIGMASTWYLLDLLLTFLAWTYTHHDPHEAVLDHAACAVTKIVFMVVGFTVMIVVSREKVAIAGIRRVQPRRGKKAGRYVRFNSKRHLQDVRQCQATAGASLTIPTATAIAERQGSTTAAENAEMGQAPHLAPMTVALSMVGTEPRSASSLVDQAEQPAVVIAWLQKRLATTMNHQCTERKQHADRAAELEDRLARTAAVATTSGAAVSTLTAGVVADRQASAAAKLALEVANEQLSIAVQERGIARATAAELTQQLAATTAAADIAVAEAQRRESVARDEIEAHEQYLKEATDPISGLRETVARQSAIAADTAGELELIRREATNAATAACADRDAITAAAAAAATSSGVVAITNSSKLALATQEAARATSMASALAEERDAANRERDRAASLVAGLRVDLEAQKAIATSATNDLVAATATIAALRAALEQKTTSATIVTIALAEAHQEASRATSSANEAVAECHAANHGRDCAVAANVDLQEALEVQTTATNTANTELATVRQEAVHAISSANEAAHAAEGERDSAVAANADLQEALTVQTTATNTATTALTNIRQEAAHAISRASEVAHTAENERENAVAANTNLQEALAAQITATSIATTDLEAVRQETARATSSANEAMAGCHDANRERDSALAANVNLQDALAAQTTATSIATTELEAVRQEAARATSSANEAVAGCHHANRERDSALAANVNLQEALAAQTTATSIVTTELEAVRQEAARATSSVNEAVAGCHHANRERDSALAANVNLQEALEVQTKATNTATTALASVRQEATGSISSANQAAHAAEGERDNVLAANVGMQEALTVQTTATNTANAALTAIRQEAAQAISWASEAAHAVEDERKKLVAANVNLQEELAAKTAAIATTTTALEAVQQELARATSSEEKAAAGFHAAESERDYAAATSAAVQAALMEKDAAATIAANELVASQENASWAVLRANAAEQRLYISEQERSRLASSSVEMKKALDQATSSANDTSNQLANAAVELAVAQQEACHASFDARTAVADVNKAIEERDSIAATAAKLQAVIDCMEMDRGNLALLEINDESMGTTAAGVPNPLASHPSDPLTASGSPRQLGPAATMSPLLLFYRDDGGSRSGAGEQGPSLTQILKQSDAWLEQTHDYIQWLFPTKQPSRMVPTAPVLSDEDIVEVSRTGGKPQLNMIFALDRMLIVYGLDLVQRGEQVVVEKGDDFDPNAKWMEPFDHNSLRLTRIISSLRAFGLGEYANALQAFLCGLPELRDHPSQEFWWSA